MTYTYRGVSYDREPLSLEVREGEIGGKYRGREWRHRYPKHVVNVAPKEGLKYRGVAYNRKPVVFTEEIRASRLAEIRAYQSEIRPNNRSLVNSLTETHSRNMRRNLERRLEIAKEQGNEELINLLERESKQLALEV